MFLGFPSSLRLQVGSPTVVSFLSIPSHMPSRNSVLGQPQEGVTGRPGGEHVVPSVRAVSDKADFSCDINPTLTQRDQAITFLVVGRDVSDLGCFCNYFFCAGCFPGISKVDFTGRSRFLLRGISCVLGTGGQGGSMVGRGGLYVTQDPAHHSLVGGPD